MSGEKEDAARTADDGQLEALLESIRVLERVARKLGLVAVTPAKPEKPARVYYSAAKQMWIAEVFGLRFARPGLCAVVRAANLNTLRTVEGLGAYYEGGLEQLLLDSPALVESLYSAIADLEVQHHAAHEAEHKYVRDAAKGNLC